MNHQWIAKIRLVGTERPSGGCERYAREFLGHRFAAAEFLEHAANDRLDRGEHVVLGDETHFQVELIEFAGRAIGAGVLVTKARRDLEIAVETGDHDQLFELLRRLRQGVEFSGMQPRRHQIVTRAFRGRGGEDRRLEFEKALCLHLSPQQIDDRAALHDVLVQMLAPQIEEAIAEPDVFGVIVLAEYRHRQIGGPPQNLDLADVNFHRPGRQIGVVGAVGAPPHLAVDAHHPFRAQRLGYLERWAVGIGDDLGEAVMVAQIDEQHAAVVADAMAPAGKTDLGPDIAVAKIAAFMGAIAVHCRLHCLFDCCWPERGKRTRGRLCQGAQQVPRCRRSPGNACCQTPTRTEYVWPKHDAKRRPAASAK